MYKYMYFITQSCRAVRPFAPGPPESLLGSRPLRTGT